MGFWKSLGNAISKGVSTVIETTKKVIGNIGQSMDRWASGGKKVEQAMSIGTKDLGTAKKTIESVIDYANLATKYHNEMLPICKELEQEFLNYYFNTFESLELEDSPISKKTKEVINKSIIDGSIGLKGTITKHLTNKVAKGNVEFERIINETHGSTREIKMASFLANVRRDSVLLFADKTREEVKKQYRFIEEYLNGEIENLELRASKSIEELENIKSNDGKDADSKRSKLIDYSIIVSQCDYIVNN